MDGFCERGWDLRYYLANQSRYLKQIVDMTEAADNWDWTPYVVYCSDCSGADFYLRLGTDYEAAAAIREHAALGHEPQCRSNGKYLELDPRDYLEVN